MTQCLHCHEWSPHEHWYHYPPDALIRTDEYIGAPATNCTQNAEKWQVHE